MINNYIEKRLILIGERLKKVREDLGYTQEDIAKELKIGRPRYSDIENGKRDVALKDLYRFSEFFRKPAEYFLKEKLAVDTNFKVLFRSAEKNKKIEKIIMEFENLCEKMCIVQEIMDSRINHVIPDDYPYEKNRLLFWGQYCANLERNRLNLGEAPIRNLEHILEEHFGLKIFYLPIPEEAKVFGMFTYSDKIGGCILINSRASLGKQIFSLAHEYGHFIFHKKRLGIISYEKEKNTSDEKLADYFASNFLMPENSVITIFRFRIRKPQKITAEDIIYFADFFGVSFQAMIYRLNNLKLLSNQTKEQLINETWVTAVRKSMGISEPERGKHKFPRLYLHLCLKAYKQGRITTSRLGDFLEIPLYRAMELGKEIRGSTEDAQPDLI
jgi:Zn-dependent peptidase ImmA (M78 family)/transcriptional regulator with XRE-family HTH domain